MPNLIPDWLPWMRPAGRLILAVIVFFIGLAIAGLLARRPKPDRPATWSECMAGAVGTFGLMALGYAVIPSEWLYFSDKYLQWDTTKFVFQAKQKMLFFPWNWPFNFVKQDLRDFIVIGIYVVMLSLNIILFSKWQKRGTAAAEAATESPRVSRFGRPLRRARQPATVGATNGGGNGSGGEP
jgi:hypothetical protein